MDGVLRGKVTRVSGGQVWVVVARLGKGERGPLTYLRHRVAGPAWTLAPAVGDVVLVGIVEGSVDELIVLGVQA